MYNNKMIKSILSRVLSIEIANQEKWKNDDVELFGKTPIDRDTIISNIKAYMEENDIPFSYDWYFSIRGVM